MRRKSRCPMTISSVEASRKGSRPISMRRGTAVAASLLWSVEKVPCESGIYGDFRRFPITYLSHENHIRILAYERTQAGCKREVRFGVRLNVIDASDLVLHWIFYRGNIHIGGIAQNDERIERGRLS